MEKNVDATVSPHSRHAQRSDLLLRHCASLGSAENRVPARRRLELLIGQDLTRLLLESLRPHSRR